MPYFVCMQIKNPLFCLLFSFPLLLCGQSTGNSDRLAEKLEGWFPLASGIVTYTLTGEASGKVTLYFDRNGWRMAEIKTLEYTRYGLTSSENTLDLTDGDYRYRVNIAEQKGEKSTDKTRSSLMGYKSRAEALIGWMASESGTLQRTDSLLGKPCQVWGFAKGTTQEMWTWEGLPLKVVKRLPGLSYELTAVAIQENVPIPEVSFGLPDGITWR